jgi:hypothetical protein
VGLCLVDGYQCFREPYRLHLRSRRKMEAEGSHKLTVLVVSKYSVTSQHTTVQCHIPAHHGTVSHPSTPRYSVTSQHTTVQCHIPAHRGTVSHPSTPRYGVTSRHTAVQCHIPAHHNMKLYVDMLRRKLRTCQMLWNYPEVSSRLQRE